MVSTSERLPRDSKLPLMTPHSSILKLQYNQAALKESLCLVHEHDQL